MPAFRRGSIGTSDVALDIQVDTKPASAPVNRNAAPGAKPNRYGGKCRSCGIYVGAGEGVLVGSAGAWGVQHGECPTGEEVRVAEAKAAEPKHQANTVNGETLYDGVYTAENGNSHRTFRLRTQGLDEDFMPGAQIMQVLNGADNDRDYQSIGHIKNGRLFVWKKHQDRVTLVADATAFMKDPQAALKSAECFRCGRTLTVPASIHDGLGPECAKRGM